MTQTNSGTPEQIRLARQSDLDDIQACARAAYEQYVPLIGREPAPMVADFADHIAKSQVWVAHSADTLVGYIVFHTRDAAMFLENIAVHPTFAGQGIGRVLLDFCEKSARSAAMTSVQLYTNAKMSANLSLYPRLGYRETERRTEQGFDRVYFEKNL